VGREPAPTQEAAQAVATGVPGAPAIDPEAMRLYDEGLRHFRAGAYDDAIASLQSAYYKTPLPALLYDLGQAYRLKGDCAQALGAYEHFLATGPVGRQRTLTEARVADMQRCAAPSANQDAADGAGAAGDSMTTRSAEPPAPRLSATAPATPPALSLASRPSNDSSPARARSRLPAIVVGGLAAGFASASGVFAWNASNASDKVTGTFVPGGMWSDDAREADRSGRWSDRLSIACGAAAVVSAGVAAWLFWR
jgi:hypothetical protein